MILSLLKVHSLTLILSVFLALHHTSPPLGRVGVSLFLETYLVLTNLAQEREFLTTSFPWHTYRAYLQAALKVDKVALIVCGPSTRVGTFTFKWPNSHTYSLFIAGLRMLKPARAEVIHDPCNSPSSDVIEFANGIAPSAEPQPSDSSPLIILRVSVQVESCTHAEFPCHFFGKFIN